MSLTKQTVRSRMKMVAGDPKFERIGDAGEVVDKKRKPDRTMIAMLDGKGWNVDDANNIVEIYLLAKKRLDKIVDDGDDTNMRHTQGSTTPVIDVRNIEGNIISRMLVTASKRKGSNSQSRRGEQKAAENGELGAHGVDAGAVNRQYKKSLR